MQRAKAESAWQALDLVFCGPTEGYCHQTKTRENFNRLLKKIGLPHMGVHDLRHNASTFLQMVLRMPAKMVQDILGHDDLEMTFDYTHSNLTMQRAMMDDLDRFFDGLSGEKQQHTPLAPKPGSSDEKQRNGLSLLRCFLYPWQKIIHLTGL